MNRWLWRIYLDGAEHEMPDLIQSESGPTDVAWGDSSGWFIIDNVEGSTFVCLASKIRKMEVIPVKAQAGPGAN